MKRFYMGSASLNKGGTPGLTVYDTLAEAIDAVRTVVAKTGEARYVVEAVAKVETAEPPTKVTYLKPDLDSW